MTLNRLLITSVVVENRPVRDVAAQYGVSESWLFELLARYKAEGEAANAEYKHSRVKQYHKDGRALRIETVINKPDDLLCKRRLQHLEELQSKARAINARLLP